MPQPTFTNGTTTGSKSQALRFDAADLDYLILHLTVPQLRHECHHADVMLSLAKQFGTGSEPFWESYFQAVQEALEIALWLQTPVLKHRRNHTSGHCISVSEIRAGVDIVTVISQYVQLRKSGSRFVGLCPFHDDRSPSFFVYPDTQTWYCFGCNQGGDVISFAMKINNLDFSEAIKILAGR
jgi:hypothetical protein